jgi:hypothetical protein
LRALLASHFGADVVVQAAPPTRIGDEDQPPALDPGLSLAVVLVDLAATPEPDSQGRFLQALRLQSAGVPMLLAADETGFRRRFAGLPARLDERRAAWRALADAHGVPFVAAELESPQMAPGAAALGAALQRAAGQ